MIRFRAWDGGSLCRMYSPSEVMVDDSDIWILDEDSEGNEWIVNNDLSLMQSTGLTDSVGKEIFEGDILKSTEPSNNLYIAKWQETKAMYLAEEVIEVFKLPPEPLYKLLDGPFTTVVIGNVYETPELLEVDS